MHTTVFDLKHVLKTRTGSERFQLNIQTFKVTQGETLALIGPSGCGKSTALDLLSCALRPDSGERFLFSPSGEVTENILRYWKLAGVDALASVRMHSLGYVLQTGGLLPFLSAGDNITLICKVLNIMPARIRSIHGMVEKLGILHLLSRFPAQLSIGERQRVAIAKALAHGPTVVLADEPTAALDPGHARLVMKLFMDIASRQGTTVVMVSHDQALADQLGFRLVPIRVKVELNSVTASLSYIG